MAIRAIIFDWIGTLYDRERGAYPFSEEVLINLRDKGYVLGLISQARFGVEKREEEIIVSGLKMYFDQVIATTEKTDRLYLQCIESMGFTPKEVAIVDDRIKRGIAAGNRIGCQTYWIQTGEWSHEKPDNETGEPTRKINSVEDLRTIF